MTKRTERRRAYRSVGCCYYCGDRAPARFATCYACRVKRRKRDTKLRASRVEDCKRNHWCRHCGPRRPAADGSVYCQRCLEWKREYRKRHVGSSTAKWKVLLMHIGNTRPKLIARAKRELAGEVAPPHPPKRHRRNIEREERLANQIANIPKTPFGDLCREMLLRYGGPRF